MSWFHGVRSDERGATSFEYAIVASLIAVVIVAAVGVFGRQVVSLFDRLTTEFHP